MSDWSGYDESGLGSSDADAQSEALYGLWKKLGNTQIGRLIQAPFVPGRAAGGQYDTQAATPGVWTDEDEARSQLNNQAMHDQAGDLANLAVGGGLPSVTMEAASAASRRPSFGSLTPVYHGTTKPFDHLQAPEPDFMIDRALGVHTARDPQIANSFVTDPHTGVPKDGGRVLPLRLDDSRHLPITQERYSSGALASDQNVIEQMAAREAYKADPEMLARYLTEARAIPAEKAGPMAADLAAGKTVTLENRPYDLDRFLSNFGGRPYNAPDRARMVELARDTWQGQGYDGLRYTNTSPMETRGVNDPTSYLTFDPAKLQNGIAAPEEPRSFWGSLARSSRGTLGSTAGAGLEGEQLRLPGITPEPMEAPTPKPPPPPPGTNPGGFYSAAARKVENAPAATRTAEEWGGWLRNNDVKATELTSLGLNPDAINPGLRGQKLDKETLLGHIRENTPKFRETVLGEPEPPPDPFPELERENAYHFNLLRNHGLEPQIDPADDSLRFANTGRDGPDHYSARDLDLEGRPREVTRAAEHLEDELAGIRDEEQDGPATSHKTQYESYSGTPWEDGERRDIEPDPDYRERLMQLVRTSRGGIEPDALAVRKYQKSRDDITAKIKAIDDQIDQAGAGWRVQTLKDHGFTGQRDVEIFGPDGRSRGQNSGTRKSDEALIRDWSAESGEGANLDKLYEQKQQLNRLQDQIKDRMLDDTWQRKPYWQNRGMLHGGEDIARRAKEIEDPHGELSEDQGLREQRSLDQAREEMQPHGSGVPYHYQAPHFHGEPAQRDLAFHNRDTEGWLPGVGSTHHVEEFQSDLHQRARDKGYQLPPQPKPTLDEAMKKTGLSVEEVPNFLGRKAKMDIENRIIDSTYANDPDMQKYASDFYGLHPGFDLWGSTRDSVAKKAVENGAITPEEAEQWNHALANPSPFRLKHGDVPVKGESYNSREEAEQAILKTMTGGANGIYRLPQGAKRFEPGQPDPAPRKTGPDGKALPAEPLQTHAVQLPQSYRGKSIFYGESPEIAENNALAWMQDSYNREFPDFPFKNWHELALKKAVLDAVAKGKSAVTWWPGEVHNERYQFVHHVEELRYNPETHELRALPIDGSGWDSHRVKPEDLADYVGPHLAERLKRPAGHRSVADDPDVSDIQAEYSHWLTRNRLPRHEMDELEHEVPLTSQQLSTLEHFQSRLSDASENATGPGFNSIRDDDLRVTTPEGQGNNGFYDDMQPRTANALFKKYGVKMERGRVTTANGDGPAHVLKITPKLLDAARNEGLTLFQAGVPLPHILNKGRDDNGQ